MNKKHIPIVIFAGALIALFVAIPNASAAGSTHDFVGAQACKSCHASEYDVWSKGPHARAEESLSEEERKNPRCLSCHAMVPKDNNPVFRGIQCESCHGEGRYYSLSYIMQDAELRGALGLQKGDANTCKRCHTESSPSIRPFEFAAKAQRIKHWK